MAAKKRSNDTSNDDRKSKKPKTEKPTTKAVPPAASTLISEEVDFPRGGGTSLSALEVKTLRAEAVKEADEALFEVCETAVVIYSAVKYLQIAV